MNEPTDPAPRGGLRIAGATSGRVLRLKVGYNPNSSSIGTIVFGMPATLAVATVAFGAAAGVLCAALLRARAVRGAPSPTTRGPDPTTNGGPAEAPRDDDTAASTRERLTHPSDEPDDGVRPPTDEPGNGVRPPTDEPDDGVRHAADELTDGGEAGRP